MAVTNAISGLTAIGGMLLLSHIASSSSELSLTDPVLLTGAAATFLSFVNIVGGFSVSGKMLDLFKRDTDPDDFFGLWLVPAGLLVGGLVTAANGIFGDLSQMSGAVQIASSIACISAIAGLANQETAKKGNFLGIAGVGFGLASTVADMSLAGAGTTSFAVLGGAAAAGGGVGSVLSSSVGPTELPQTVAGFHSLVGLAAMLAAIGEYFNASGGDGLQAGTAVAVYLATLIGGITFTGSLVAYGKLAQLLGSTPLKLPGRDLLNLGGLLVSLIGLGLFVDPSLAASLSLPVDPGTIQLASLATVSVISR